MQPRQKYVKLTQSWILVRPEQKEHVELFVEKHGISVNQFMRDVIQHAMDCPFFNGRNTVVGIPPPTEGSNT